MATETRPDGKIALVTGGNRGIGLEVCRQLASRGCHVLLGSRDEHKGAAAVEKLQGLLGKVELVVMDVSRPDALGAAFDSVIKKFGRVDILINNAGILEDDREGGSVFSVTSTLVEKTFRTNTVAPYLLCQKAIPLMVKNGFGRVVNLSSGLGQLSEMGGGYAAYRLSKTALNAVTRAFSAEAKHPNVLINSVCPGWVKTDMGGPNAARPVEKGAETVVWLATDPAVTKTGLFFRDKAVIPW